MSESEKTWVIGITDDLEIKSNAPELSAPTLPRVRSERRAAPPVAPPRLQPKTTVPPPTGRRMHYALLLSLTYLLGPFAMLLTSAGRRDRSAAAAGCIAGAAGLGLLLYRDAILSSVGAGWAAILLVFAVVLILQVGFTAWARAVVVTRNPDRAGYKQDCLSLPAWMRRPWAMGGFGFLIPGAGLLLAGRTGRGALALWSTQFAIAAALMLWHAKWFWQIVQNQSLGAIGSKQLEVAFLVCGLILGAWGLIWIAQVLEGYRQGLRAQQLTHSVHGDRYALALVLAWVVLTVTAQPSAVAFRLDSFADRLQADGYQIIPLTLTEAAHRLDPGQTGYALQAMELHAALGNDHQVESWQARLDTDLRSYLESRSNESVPTVAAEPVYYAQTEPVQESPAAPTDLPVAAPVSIDQEPQIAETIEAATDSNEAWGALQAAMFGTFAQPVPK